MVRRWVVAFLFLICTPNLGFAWGELGHVVVADIASHFLSPNTAAEVQQLLGEDVRSMAEIASWADEIVEERSETYPWHVVPIPSNGLQYDHDRDCPDNDCIVEKIPELMKTLADRTAERSMRIDALKFLIHFVGDLHMPLHALVGLNRYKNGAWVRIGDTTDKLHLWWDNGFVVALGLGPAELANELTSQITTEDRTKWEKGTSADWANESFQISQDFVTKYNLLNVQWSQFSEDKPLVLPVEVLEDVKPTVVLRLKMAGVRLAWLLNQALQ